MRCGYNIISCWRGIRSKNSWRGSSFLILRYNCALFICYFFSGNKRRNNSLSNIILYRTRRYSNLVLCVSWRGIAESMVYSSWIYMSLRSNNLTDWSDYLIWLCYYLTVSMNILIWSECISYYLWIRTNYWCFIMNNLTWMTF